jgi:hypothetical protein
MRHSRLPPSFEILAVAAAVVLWRFDRCKNRGFTRLSEVSAVEAVVLSRFMLTQNNPYPVFPYFGTKFFVFRIEVETATAATAEVP